MVVPSTILRGETASFVAPPSSPSHNIRLRQAPAHLRMLPTVAFATRGITRTRLFGVPEVSRTQIRSYNKDNNLQDSSFDSNSLNEHLHHDETWSRSSHPHLSARGQQIFDTLIDPSFDWNRLDEILHQLFEADPEQTNSYSVNSLTLEISGILKNLGLNQKHELALRMFDWVQRREDCASLLSSSVITAIIDVLGNAHQVSSAASLLHNLETNGIEVDVYAYNSLIKTYARNQKYSDAVKVFKKMAELGCRPNLSTFHVMFHVYEKMDMPRSEIIALVHCLKLKSHAPDSDTYNTLIRFCLRESLYREAVELFEEMKLAGFTPDKVTYNALVDVYGISRRPKEAMGLLQEMESNGFPPCIETYTSLISDYATGGLLGEALELITQMVEKGIRPDASTYNALLKGFEKSGEEEFVKKAFKEMRTAGCNPNMHIFNCLIKMYGIQGKFVVMKKVWEEMKVCKCSPDIVTWNTLLGVYGKNGLESEVSEVFQEMKRAGFVPKRDNFNTLISAFGRGGSYDQVMDIIYKRMPEAGVTPDLSTYNDVLEALARGGLWEQSEKVLAEMKENQCKPNEQTYYYLHHAYANGM